MKPMVTQCYYQLKFGYIIVSYGLVGDNVMWSAVEPIITKPSDVDSRELGEAIKEGLHKSQNTLPLEEDEEPYSFWRVSGIKGFSSFTRKFQCVSISGKDDVLRVNKMERDAEGWMIVTRAGKEKEIHLKLDTPTEELGRIVKDLFSGKEISQENDIDSFVTLNNNKVTYKRPSEYFEDVGDGGGDAYQIYAYEKDENSYLAFLSTGECTGLTEEEIKAYWERVYGELEEFTYEELSDKTEKAVINGRTKQSKIVANLYQDNEDLMEVIIEINLELDVKEREMIEDEIRKVMDSIAITETRG